LKVPQPYSLPLCPSEKSGEFLAVDVKAETEAIPAEKAAEAFVEF